MENLQFDLYSYGMFDLYSYGMFIGANYESLRMISSDFISWYSLSTISSCS